MMNKPAILSSLFIASQLCASTAIAETAPAELSRFIETGTRLLTYKSADLNGDGTKDYVVVLQGSDETASRPLLILLRDKAGTLKLAKRNDNIVGCEGCGGSMGDPFESLEVRDKGFTVSNSGGSAHRWSNSFEFAYSRRDQTWQLVRAVETSYYSPDADATVKTSVYRPPKDFGKIDIEDFSPDQYLKAQRK